ncbi:putative protein involved in cytokinesis, contains TGc (transglutaminase/protease-like) domain [Anaerohalosphaera lusitana]|uniref:Transglutaminase-like domain-containing protein n=1 Tax=Anaerohalosphaera lusitana TaxID=1936003 RepID=A0A1U9NJJ5_9BACT|nr:transglutaminase domain-containing protein [Anaerohalosphaera lusitana]AQT67977.1 putative protein involved in cytokinesis, contains TGc (transglutaminase/protease-like) domain [Anaerohalosphaera lusitana]
MKKKRRYITFAMVAILALIAVIVIIQYRVRPSTAEAGSGRTLILEYTAEISGVPASNNPMKIFIPVAMDDEGQTLHGFEVAGDWDYEIVSEAEYENRFILINTTTEEYRANDEPVQVRYFVTRYDVSPVTAEGSRWPLTTEKERKYLTGTRMLPTTGKIAEEASSVAGNSYTDLTKARILYNHIVDTVEYDKSGEGWGRGDAMYACNVRKGNCTDFHSLFIAEARALGIPARFIMGLPLPADKDAGVIEGYHCWAEFYTDEKGWLPVDASEASKNPGKRDAYFGRLDRNRVAFTIGRDIRLPESKAEPLNFAIYPYVEIDGREHKDVEAAFEFEETTMSYVQIMLEGERNNDAG